MSSVFVKIRRQTKQIALALLTVEKPRPAGDLACLR